MHACMCEGSKGHHVHDSRHRHLGVQVLGQAGAHLATLSPCVWVRKGTGGSGPESGGPPKGVSASALGLSHAARWHLPNTTSIPAQPARGLPRPTILAIQETIIYVVCGLDQRAALSGPCGRMTFTVALVLN